MDYEFFETATPPLVLRRDDDDVIDELTADGWRPAPWHRDTISQLEPRDEILLDRRHRQRMNTTALKGPRQLAGSVLMRRLREWAVPPLDYGAPRHLRTEQVQDDAESAYAEELREGLAEELLEEVLAQARDGYERQGKRVEGIERRAGLYQGGASVSGGLVLTGTGLLAGKDAVFDGALRWVALAGLVVVSLCLVASGWRAHQASVFTFGWARPNIRRKVLRRAQLTKLDEARRSLLCALLLAQDRGQIIVKWKLARLKQSSRYFAVAIAASGLVSVLLVVTVLTAD